MISCHQPCQSAVHRSALIVRAMGDTGDDDDF
jgi:hypothetical protein